MKKIAVLPALLSLALAAPLAAEDDRHQSYVSWEEGGSTILQAFDERRITAQRNLPVYVGDVVETARRGRIEVTLADGNVLAMDRDSRVKLEQIAYSYEREGFEETVLNLGYGQVIVHRPDSGSVAPVRIDTSVASYAGGVDSIFSIESAGRGRDTVSVFAGTVEVRTRSGRERLRQGEQVSVDGDGVYGSNTVVRGGTSDFERWYLERASRYGRSSSRYLPERFSSYERDLDGHGSWVYVSSIRSYAWRPFGVGRSWRPYYDGYWAWSPSGSVWVSHEPWGWLPYHYGRWTYAAGYGWVWLPASVYSPAWVYWIYGRSYVGWVPAGWYDCYPAYWNWRYQPHYGRGIDVGFGFYGRVSLRNVNLEGWTFVDSNSLYSRRADQASLTIDAVRSRLSRNGDQATFSSVAARFDRSDLQNPSAAVERIARVGLDRSQGTGRDGSGSLTDVTSFVRRDPELSPNLREQVSRVRGGTPATVDTMARPGRISRPGSTPTVATPALRGGAIDVSPAAPRSGLDRGVPATGTMNPPSRTVDAPSRSGITRGERPGATPEAPAESRSGIVRTRPVAETPAAPAPRTETAEPPARVRPTVPEVRRSEPSENWRRPTVEHGESSGIARDRGLRDTGTRESRAIEGSRPVTVPRDDTPRRVIESIRGSEGRRAVVPSRPSTPAATPSRESTRSRGTDTGSAGRVRVERPAATPRPSTTSQPAPRRDSSSDDSSSRSTNMRKPD